MLAAAASRLKSASNLARPRTRAWRPPCFRRTRCASLRSTLGALRISAGSDGVEEFPVWFAGVEQRPDPVVGESSEPVGGAFDAFDEVVDCYLEGLVLLWLGAGVSCGRHVVDGGGGTVLALVAELLGEVFSEVVVVGFESGDFVEGGFESLSQRFG